MIMRMINLWIFSLFKREKKRSHNHEFIYIHVSLTSLKVCERQLVRLIVILTMNNFVRNGNFLFQWKLIKEDLYQFTHMMNRTCIVERETLCTPYYNKKVAFFFGGGGVQKQRWFIFLKPAIWWFIGKRERYIVS